MRSALDTLLAVPLLILSMLLPLAVVSPAPARMPPGLSPGPGGPWPGYVGVRRPISAAERAAWEEERRGRERPVYYVLGCLAAPTRLGLWEFADRYINWQDGPAWGWRGDGLGHGFQDSVSPPIDAEISRLTVAALEREAEEARKILAGQRGRQDPRVAQALERLDELLRQERARYEALSKEGKKLRNGLDDAHAVARLAASRYSIRAVAVVDLYSRPDPVVLAWYFDEGSGVKCAERPPSADLDHWLSECLLEIQYRAERR
jgi:hypothetical protein